MKRYFWPIVGVLIFLVLIFGGAVVGLYTDLLWFADLGFASIFTKIIWTRITLGAIFATIFFVIVYFNLLLARRLAPPLTSHYGPLDEMRARMGDIARQWLGLLLFAGTLFVSVLVGIEAASHWDEWLRFTNATPFGVRDPQFGIDVGFYVFKLPFWNYLYGWFFFALFAAAVATALLHYADQGIDFLANTPRFAPGVKSHLAVLIALLFFLKAIGYKLMMYSLLTTPGDIFTGAAYTDVHARLPGLWILLVVAIIGGLAVLVNTRRSGIWHAAAAVVGLVVVSIIAGGIYPAILESVVVKPNELEKQRPYIKRAIDLTRKGYRVDNIAARTFNYVPDLTAEEISRNRAAIQNLRLWDYGPLKRTYQATQELQQYYDFHDVDIDRYMLDSNYRQVMLSARELAGPPQSAQTWVNRFLRYTHGYAYAMSPVNAVTGEGLPVFFAGGIPPVTRPDLEIKAPQIYFGELTNNYVIVNTVRKEFDYPIGGTDHESNYSAKSGPVIGSFLRKLAFAIRFGDANIILSNDIRPTSRVLFRRNIGQREQAIFPFLSFDNDPYLVTLEGKLYWFHDAYTTTDQYPYSQPTDFGFQQAEISVNYIRNSVKLVTDAYTGKVQAFVSDPSDPMIRTYSRIFPGVFKPISEMPAAFRAHVRYPEDLLTIQAQLFSRYHMTDPTAFYSNTDLWQIPSVALQDSSDSEEMLEPYYIITKLPNSPVEEFILIVPLVRPQKNNMVAWMAAKCDPADYGKLIAYEFPRGQLVFGPRQVMARANQDTRISEQLTLWNQSGSKVVRGKLLAIPIENSILYVEPLYLESTSTGIPEFKRVITSLGDRLAMEPTLEAALASVTGVTNLPTAAETAGIPGIAAPSGAAPPASVLPPSPRVRDLTKRANQEFNRAQDAQRRGDWAEYGRQLDALKKTLGELQSAGGR